MIGFMIAALPQEDNPFSGWTGSPDVGWLGPMKDPVATILGMGKGAAIVVAIIMIVVGAILIMVAGNSIDRRSRGAGIIISVLYGTGILLIGLPIFTIVVGRMYNLFPS